ncbi:nicotinate N-methyltransferase 1-like [Corylus avellana]|uniref:nicotinate N-methyltransferase 1-like n=1 Tax=Corylus avellana TaxID=13451 RepID=UPI00286CB585|nr:nicotinate N-methyltransferase 1-like [Corylus avellana]
MEEESKESKNIARLTIMELANMTSVSMSLNVIVRLNIPEAIWEGGSNTPLFAAQIVARALPSGDLENLQLILCMLTNYDMFQEQLTHSKRKYSLTEIAKMLVTDVDGL